MIYCNQCKITTKEKDRTELNPSLIIIKLTCGHSKILGPLGSADKIESFLDSFETRDAKRCKLFKYQREDIHKASKAFGRCLFRYEVGLGKTPESLACVETFELHPAIILTKPTLVYQWLKEIFRWTGRIGYIIKKPYDLQNGMIGMFPYLIMSLDLARQFEDDIIENFPARTVIIDECQHIKNLDSARTIHVRKLCRNKDYIFGLSATPIKNRFDEYFPILNIIRPDLFKSYTQFVEQWCEHYETALG